MRRVLIIILPGGKQSRPGNNGNSFGLGHTHNAVVHEDLAVRADFDKYECASNSWWKTWSGMKNGEIIEFNGRTMAKALVNEMRAMRYVTKKCSDNARKAAKKAAVLVKGDAARDAAKKQLSSFYK